MVEKFFTNKEGKMILSIKDCAILIVILIAMAFALFNLVQHARYADYLFGNLTEETVK